MVARPDLEYLYLALKEISWVLPEPKETSGQVWVSVKRPLQRNSDQILDRSFPSNPTAQVT